MRIFRAAWASVCLVNAALCLTGCASSDKPSGGGSGGSAPSSGGSGGTNAPGSGQGGSTPTTGGAGGTSAGSPVMGGGSGGQAQAGAGAGGPAGGMSGSPAGGGAGMASAGTSSSATCVFTINQTLSEKITSVGIVEWSVDHAALDSATVEFGLDTKYGHSAPVDLKEANYRTLLLGMKFDHDYHYRIVAHAGTDTCTSEDKVLHTGMAPNGLPTLAIETQQPEKVTGGYLVTERWGMNNNGPAFILDADGDIVWTYPGDVDIIRTRLDITGKKMWIRNTAQTNGTGVVKRVTLDGLHEEKWMLPNTTHDLAVIPDGHVGLVGHAPAGCDEILDFDPETEQLTSLFNASESHGNTMCHVNYLAYYAKDDSFILSDWEASTLIKITRQGDLVWALNGDGSTIGGTNWVHEHGVQSLATDELLVFSNGDTGEHSIVYDLKLDLNGKMATELWRYDGGLSVGFGGDVQRLDNGNYIITYSSAGVVQELDASRALVQTLTFSLGNTVAYSEKLKSLYDAPPPRIY